VWNFQQHAFSRSSRRRRAEPAAQIRRAADFAISRRSRRARSKKKLQPGANCVDVIPRQASRHTRPVGERVGSPAPRRAGLRCGAGHDTLVTRNLPRAVIHQVADQPQMRLGGKSHSFCAMLSLKMSSATCVTDRWPCAPRRRSYRRRHRRPDRSARVTWAGAPFETTLGPGASRSPPRSDRPRRACNVVGVATHQRRHVERHDTRHAGAEDLLVAHRWSGGVATPRTAGWSRCFRGSRSEGPGCTGFARPADRSNRAGRRLGARHRSNRMPESVVSRRRAG